IAAAPYSYCAWAGGAPPGAGSRSTPPAGGAAGSGPGALWLWGANDAGQLGDGGTSPRRAPARLSEIGDVLAATAGGGFTAVIKADGTVWSWGTNAWGELGYDPSTCPGRVCPTPRRVPGLARVRVLRALG